MGGGGQGGAGGAGGGGGGDDDMGSGGQGGAGGSSGTPFDLHVTGQITYVSDGSDATAPRDFSQLAIAAIVPSGSNSFAVYDPTAASLGSVTIADVPGVRYYLRVGTQYVLRDPGDVTLDLTRLGRSDAVARASEAATSVFTLDGMSPWQLNLDRLQLFSAGGAAYDWAVDQKIGGPVNEGQTKLDGAVETLPLLIDGAKGDVVWISQLVDKTLGDGTPYHVVTKSWNGSFTQAAAAQTDVSGAFSDVAQSQSLTATWARSQFRTRAGAARAQSCVDTFDVAAQPGLAAHGVFSDEPDLLIIDAKDGSDDISLAGVAYGNPFPASWGLVATVDTVCTVEVPSAPGALKPLLSARASVSDTLAKIVAGGAAPRVAGVVSPTIAGKDAMTAQGGVGTTPTFAWQAPAGNAPTATTVNLYRIVDDNGKATVSLIAKLSTGKTGATALRVPPSILTLGSRYAATISSIRDEDKVASSYVTTVLGTFWP
jgi:hypothetical protein